MDRTKEKVYEKRKLWKIFTLKRPQFLQKMLAVGVSASLILSMAPKIGVFAADEPTTFITEANGNHWGRSDLRAYLNGVEKVDNTLPLDTTDSGSNATGYASHFSDAEFALVKPFKYNTNVLNSAGGADSVYETTDRFWLPSGNYSSDNVLGWGATDVSLDSDYRDKFDSAHAIPISYWPAGASLFSWLRSHGYYDGVDALHAYRGNCVDSGDVHHYNAAAAAFKLDLSSVIFASAASAASLAAAGGSRKFEIDGSSNFGSAVDSALPAYGMYLKTGSGSTVTFTPDTSLTYDPTAKTLTVPYTGGVAGQYVVVQAFKEDSLGTATTFYAAAKELTAGQTSVSLDVSNWTDASGQQLANLDGYTLKVWMEDASGGSSLAAATKPVTFVGRADGSIEQVTDDSEAKNQRVFAMTEDLQTSWGTLASKTALVGTKPTNQKIYFGKYAVKDDDGNFVKDSSGNQVYAPLEFWIAGRENYAGDPDVLVGDGTIDPTGEIMTLYQAKSVEKRQFNASASNYKAVPTLTLEDGQSKDYTGSELGPALFYKFNGSDIVSTPNITYQYRVKDSGSGWTAGLPTDAGTYEVRGVAASTSDYETATSAPVTFTINQAVPTYTAPSLTPQEIVYGSKLSQVDLSAYNLGSPTFGDGKTITGTWSWVDDSQSVGTVGTNNFTAKFTPTDEADKTNFIWSNLSGYNSTVGALTVSVPVTVQPLPVNIDTITIDDDGLVYNGSVQTPEITINGTGNSRLLEGTDYKIEYGGDKKSAGTQPITIKFQGNYASDDNKDGIADNPDQGVKTSYTIKPAQLTVDSITAENKPYDGTDDATVKEVQFAGLVGAATLVLTTDFSVSDAKFADANVGTAKKVTATITLKNTATAQNYTFEGGSTTTSETTADISAFNISSAAVELADSTLTYTGSALRPGVSSVKVKLKQGDDTQTTLEEGEGKDYTVAYTNNTNVGTATVTITGVGNFEATKSANFTINKKSLTGATITVNPDEVTFNGASFEPEVTVELDGFSSPLVKGTDYTVEYSDNTNAGTATVTIKGKGNFKDSATTTFKISYLPSPGTSGFTVSGKTLINGAYWFAAGESATVQPPSDYTISTALNGTYGETVSLGENDTKEVYLNNTAGQMTAKIDLSGILKWDSDAPRGEIQLSTGSVWKDLISKITFGLFFKEAKTATITAEDSDSGLASIEYYVATDGVLATTDTDESAIKSALKDLPTGENGWQTYSGVQISLIEKSKNVVYAKLTDNVGNISYISSDGIVLYSDSATTTSSLEYTKLSGTNPSFDITLNKNTINEVKLGDTTLTKDNDYSVSTQNDVATISLVASKLDKEDAGDHTVKVSFNPQGEAFVGGTDNNAPDDVSVTLTIKKATPVYTAPSDSSILEATYGYTLNALLSQLETPQDVNGTELEGEWSWEDDNDNPVAGTTEVGTIGKHTFIAVFTPANKNYSPLEIKVTVNVSVDTSKWGSESTRSDGVKQYVDSAGKTSVEIAQGSLDTSGILWLREESGGTSAWYGIDLSTGAFDLDKGLRFYVQWLSPDDAEYAEIYAQLDEAQKARVEDDNGWIFLIGVEDPDGNKVQPAHPVKVYVQIGDDWDVDDLNAYYITSGADENVPVDYLVVDFPEGSSTFGIMTLSHFSPYFIFDELTDEEKAALGLPSTGDISSELLISGLAIVLVSSLGVMLRLITSKKKFEE